MQGLMRHSAENDGVDGLALFGDEVKFFGEVEAVKQQGLKVPHMGWNEVRHTVDHPIWQDIPNNSRFYFVHSYFVPAQNCESAIGVTNYGADIAAVVAKNNIVAVQFHPEKSHRDGLQLLRNFMQWDGSA